MLPASAMDNDGQQQSEGVDRQLLLWSSESLPSIISALVPASAARADCCRSLPLCECVSFPM